MELPAGSRSYDGYWLWDGHGWVPAISADGRWWWGGSGWIALETPSRAFWQPTWRRSDGVALAGWSFVVPAALALVTTAVARTLHLTPAGVFLAILGAFAVWAFIGGALVRPHGRWRETLLIAGALIALVGLVDIGAYAVSIAAGLDQAADDHGVSVGLVLLVFFVFPPTVLMVVLGRLARRGLSGVRCAGERDRRARGTRGWRGRRS